jgi:dinuclear metal center YbgI/SA1388 family protein
MKLESLVQYMDGFLDIPAHPDYRGALNGLQLSGPEDRDIEQLCAAVDASEAAIEEAASREADLLVVHHGLFWEGLRPLTGRRYRRVERLLRSGTALYSAHLPLDGHPEVGNCVLLARALDLTLEGRFGSFEGRDIGWLGAVEPTSRGGLADRIAACLGGDVRVVPGGPEAVSSVGVVTGGGGSFVEAAAETGVDALITGEGTHHTYVNAMEAGVNVFFAGHYATETFGVKALCAHLGERFGLRWTFLDHPTGM